MSRTTRILRKILSCLLLAFSGCNRIHWRPSGVPSSAVWANGVFIACTVDGQARANQCAVYADKTGKILADGLFILQGSSGPAEKSELKYVGYKDGSIFLADARILICLLASARDPQNRLIIEKLKSIASQSGGVPVLCGNTPTINPDVNVSDCAADAVKNHRAFYVRYYVPGVIYNYSYGLAGDSSGNVAEAVYNGRGFNKLGLSKRAELLEDGHLVVLPCPKPVVVAKDRDGTLACLLPLAPQLPPTDAERQPIETSICEIAEKPWVFNNKLVRVRGHVSGNFEYSEIGGDGCSDSLWFAYGDESGPPRLTAYVAGGARPGVETDRGEWIPPIRVKLVQDANFRKFQLLMVKRVRADERYDKLHPGQYLSHEVTATFVGRIDGVSPEIHAAHLKRGPMDRADYLGFGQMGLFDAQLVINSVGADAVLEPEKPTSKSE